MGSMPDNPMHFKRKRWTPPPRCSFSFIFMELRRPHEEEGGQRERDVSVFFFNGRLLLARERSPLRYFRWRWESGGETRDRVSPSLPSSLPSLIDNSGMSPELYDLIRAGGENLRRNYCTRLMEAARLIAAEREREILFPISRSLFQERKREREGERSLLCSKRIVFH